MPPSDHQCSGSSDGLAAPGSSAFQRPSGSDIPPLAPPNVRRPSGGAGPEHDTGMAAGDALLYSLPAMRRPSSGGGAGRPPYGADAVRRASFGRRQLSLGALHTQHLRQRLPLQEDVAALGEGSGKSKRPMPALEEADGAGIA